MPALTSLLRTLGTGALISTLLSACAVQPTVPTDSDWATHRDDLARLENWAFSGRLAVKSPQGAESARLQWTQRGSDLELELSGPVGMKQVRLVSEGPDVRLWKDGNWQSLDSAEQALQEQLGWSLPLDYLPWWLRGLPSPELQAGDQVIEDGRLQRLQQAGWTVEYPDYQAIDQLALPRTILFQREQVRGKILLKKWTLAP